MKAALVVLAAAAMLLGGAGGATLVLERRLAALAPGGLEIAALHYDPLSGRLVLAGVRARDGAGRERFQAEGVTATVNPLHLLARPLTLRRARVTGPRLTLAGVPGRDLVALAAGLGSTPAPTTRWPLRVDDLTVSGGHVVVEGAGERGAPLVLRDVDARLGRLTTAALDRHDVAFAVQMHVHGARLHLTGQPRDAGYAVHVRVHGLDAAALARDLGVRALAGLERGRAEIDTELLLAGGRLLASGSARATDVVVRLPVPGRPRLRASTVAVGVDTFDLGTGTGRITRLGLGAPALSLPAAAVAPALAALVELLRRRPDVLVRRVAVSDGVLALRGPRGVRLDRLQLAARAPERHGAGAWIVNARADLAAASAEVLVKHAQVSFDGHVQVAAREGPAAVTLTGRAMLVDVGRAGREGFRAESIAVGLRGLQWPTAHAVVDTVVMTRPDFALPAVLPWPPVLVSGAVSVFDGQLRGTELGRALRDLEVTLSPTPVAGSARLRLSASTEAGDRLGLDRIMPYEATAPGAVPLRLLLSALEDATRLVAQPARAGSVTPGPGF